MPSVGWDIVLTEEGPLLLEGNAVWCVDLAQLSHRRPLAETPIPTCLADYLDSDGLADKGREPKRDREPITTA
jgi:hypothetical protein